MSATAVNPFLDQLMEIRKAAAELPELAPGARRARVAEVLKFLDGPLARHAEAEERAFFPVVALRLRHPAATGALVFDHELVRERSRALNATDPTDVEALQALLYGLYAILDAHFRKEERLYLPLLESAESAEVLQAMDAIEHPILDGGARVIERGPHGFPRNGSPGEKLTWAIEFAVKAPSSHNSQPWRFRLAGDTLELRADRTRALPVVDPHDRELTISCGAALFFLRAALRHMGETTSVESFPERGDRDLLARVRLGEPAAASIDERRLFWAMRTRRTNRLRFGDRPVPEDVLAQLRQAAEQEGAQLAVIEGDAREQLAKLVSTADRRQAAQPSFRRELAAWVHPNREEARDGMPGSAYGLSDLTSTVGPLVLRTFDWGRGRAARDEELGLGSPVLAVLASHGDEPADWLATGQALGRVLLRATVEDVVSSFLNQPVEVAELRPQVGELCASEVPQLVLRFGFAKTVPPTPRRPVAEVLDDAS